MAKDDVIVRLERIEAKLADLTEAMAGVARNVDIKLLQRRVEVQIAGGHALRADLRLLTGLMSGVATSVQALVDHQMQLTARVSALEVPEP